MREGVERIRRSIVRAPVSGCGFDKQIPRPCVAARALYTKEQWQCHDGSFRKDGWEFGGADGSFRGPARSRSAQAPARHDFRLHDPLLRGRVTRRRGGRPALALRGRRRPVGRRGNGGDRLHDDDRGRDGRGVCSRRWVGSSGSRRDGSGRGGSAEEAAPEATIAEAAPAEAAPADDTASAETPAASDSATTDDTAPDNGRPASSTGKAGKGAKSGRSARAREAAFHVVLLPKLKPAAPPEIEGPADAATIWLNSQLPDPTPAALRLSPKFAAHLKAAAKGAGVDWATMLGVLRARGATGHIPANRGTLQQLASRLASHGPARGDWARIVAYSGDSNFADRAAALARYDRAVGLNALVKGLEAQKKAIASKILADRNITIYGGGRNDIVEDKVDVRVLALISYLRESFGQVTVSCLISGHRLYARPGVISAHIPGHAVDISALGETSIQGHQEPGGITERAVRDILFLPAELMPKQVISLLGMGGPSFPLADHYNHIHIGY